MNPRITQVVANDDHTLTLTFTNGEVRSFDIRPYLGYTAFHPLQNLAAFKLARPHHGTVAWPNEIDFDPDTLYLESKLVSAQSVA